MTEYTLKEWLEEFRSRCKDGRIGAQEARAVAFICPSCGTMYTLGEWAAAYEKARNSDVCPFEILVNDGPAECINRIAKNGKCDWVAYGFYCGPVAVSAERGKKIYTFEFANKEAGNEQEA